MMQPRRPISRSSTHIEFTPLVLDLEPETKEEPKVKSYGKKMSIIGTSITILLAVVGYFVLSNKDINNESHVNIAQSDLRKTELPSQEITSNNEKRRLLLQGVSNAKIVLENIDGTDVLKVVIDDKAVEGITWGYEWTKNNQPSGNGDSIRDFKRNDSMAVKILPFDGEKYGKSKILTMDIKNTIPRIIEDKVATFDGKNLTYQVKATDADGDNLTFSLVEAPTGMIINEKNGVITWPSVPENMPEVKVKVKITDGHGGDLLYPITVNLTQPVKEK